MLKKWLLPLIICWLSSTAWSWDKSRFDLPSEMQSMALNKTGNLGYEGVELKKTVSEVTLIQGGYFTIGTNQGLSQSPLDDHCGISFGHPYALTSYPIIAIDGNWGKLESFLDIYDASPKLQGDSLVINYVWEGIYQFIFSLLPDVTGKAIAIRSAFKNLDTRAHSFGMGLVLDPALGKKGDGWVELGNQLVLRDTLMSDGAIPNQLMINERNGSVAGMRVILNFSSAPDKLVLANWRDLYENQTPNFSASELRKIYDLALKIIWAEQTIPAGGSFSRSLIVDLQQPNFNTPLFMRWDLPGFLSLENNLLFPRNFDSFLEIANLAGVTKPNAQLEFQFPTALFANTGTYQFAVPANEIVYQRVKMQSKEIYEDEIVDLTVTLKHDGQILDTMLRQVFIPAVPLSDTGLVCTIDTVITSAYPEIRFTLEAEVKATGQRLFNLIAENIFLYENNNRIRQFTMGKDTTGGVTMADIVFVLDCSGSMGDDIQAVNRNINEFCDSLLARGIDFRLGLVTFSTTVDDVFDFTNDVQLFKSWLNQISLWGGRENSLGALYRATELSFRQMSKRTFIWITDEDYPVYPEINLSVQDVVNRLLLYDVTVHSISEPSLKTKWCNPIIEPTGGNFYDIHGNFRDILLDISRMGSFTRFMISYKSPGATIGTNEIIAKIHYAGLGGTAIAHYQHGSAGNQMAKSLSCYPNPFNPIVQIRANLPENSEGKVEIFNILGQRVKQFQLQSPAVKIGAITWDARDEFDQPVGVGTYLVRLTITDQSGKITGHEFAKILYLK
ncbi:MAG: VWA domain-containing protein [candidate division KSB1 bacterium]|nr:VWA domain-containing protein [candidate division KSB1 bacterium]MDZ7334390.1 VWA domain-containing protein [candidate division KSB1 bacterium]MDZ7358260.1 VWA domain-containing protein [candidate division KSB1 bacterium]MDZ7398803.1 VWA domain-containing protein [candidate division KSB1 bacterium]